MDELAAVIDVTDALDDSAAGRFDLIVMDTAPSGHALRLLEMPSLVQDWVRTLMSILLKYQSVTGLGELGAMLLKLSQGLGRLRELLTDAGRARFIVVTRAAALPRAETGRLLARLRAMHIDVPVIVINAVGRGTCRRCRTAVASERREIAALRRLAAGSRRDTVVVLAPAEVPPPHGPGELRRWSVGWGLAQLQAGAEISSNDVHDAPHRHLPLLRRALHDRAVVGARARRPAWCDTSDPRVRRPLAAVGRRGGAAGNVWRRPTRERLARHAVGG